MAFLKAYRNPQVSTPESDIGRLAGYRQSLADRCDDGVAIVDGNGTIQFANDALFSMHNYDRKDSLIGRNVGMFYQKKTADDVNRFIAQTKLLGWYIATVNQLRSDGSIFAAQIKMVALKDESGKLCGILLIMADMSRLAGIQKMIERTNKELEMLKDRLARIEGNTDRIIKPMVHSEETPKKEISTINQPLPICELKQLAEMAKRFR
jgi:PAS domain S-box-containing protein